MSFVARGLAVWTSHTSIRRQHEPCFFGWIKGNKPMRISDDYPPSVRPFPTHAHAAGETTDHPTQKPVELFAIPMCRHTKKGDLCYEPLSGSGTQLVAAVSIGGVCCARGTGVIGLGGGRSPR
jgi:DNA modification methylase